MGSASSITKSSKLHDTQQENNTRLDPKDNPNKLSRVVFLDSTNHTTKQKLKENLEPFTLVCLDDDCGNNYDDFQTAIDYICCFNDLKRCEEFILNDIKNEHIFFIVSSPYVTNIVSYIHDAKQILAIYILQQNTLEYNGNTGKDIIDDQWTKRYSKVRGIYSNRNDILEELLSNVKIYTNIDDLLPITIYNRLDTSQRNSLSNDYLRFLFYRLFIYQYCLKTSSLNKKQLLTFVRDYYHINENELKYIKKFDEEYNSKKNVLSWFLQNVFLRKLLTKSLLVLNLKVLFQLTFFIHDLHKTMVDIGLSPNANSTEKERILYRGQIISEETFGRIKSNIGELLSINNFFLTSQDRHNMLTMIRKTVPSSRVIYRVLFEIKIPSNYEIQQQRPFIDITHLSLDSYTTLFAIGSIFLINTVTFDINNDFWIIQLTLFDERVNSDFAPLFAFLKENQSPIILANLLRQISPKSAQQFYKHILKENSEPMSKIQCYHGLGQCSYAFEDYKQALIYFEQALELKPKEPSINSSLHNSIGLVYAQQNNIAQAHTHFSEALKSCSLPLQVASVHFNLGLAYGQQSSYDKELTHYQEAIKIRNDELPANHVQVASLYNNIGVAYLDLHDYNNALLNLRKALEMRLKLLSEDHIDVARSYANMGSVYTRTKDYRVALEYFNKALLLFQKQESIPEEDLQKVKQNIQIVKDRMD